jgi:hypothetical protein
MMRAASSFPDADREPTSQSERVNPIIVTEYAWAAVEAAPRR